MSEQRPQGFKLVELDSLRGLMALWVFVTHVALFAGLPGTGIWFYVSNGATAVNVFIILSGFAIASSLINSRSSYRNYIARRFFRIYPIYAVGLVLGIATVHLYPGLLQGWGWTDPADVARLALRGESERDAFLAHLFAHLTLIHGAIPDKALYGASLSLNSPAWSLSLEAQFYVIAPLLVAALADPRRRLASFCFWIGLALAGPLIFGRFYPLVPSFLPLRLGYFIIGILTAIHLPRLARDPALLLGAAAGLIAAGTLFAKATTAIPLLIWIVVLMIASLDDVTVLRRLRAVLLTRPLVAMGECSYGFYILHLPILIAWGALLQAFGIGADRWTLVAALFVPLPITILIAHICYRRFELPINRWAKRRYGGARLKPIADATELPATPVAPPSTGRP